MLQLQAWRDSEFCVVDNNLLLCVYIYKSRFCPNLLLLIKTFLYRRGPGTTYGSAKSVQRSRLKQYPLQDSVAKGPMTLGRAP